MAFLSGLSGERFQIEMPGLQNENENVHQKTRLPYTVQRMVNGQEGFDRFIVSGKSGMNPVIQTVCSVSYDLSFLHSVVTEIPSRSAARR
jgi:hypothetical protein